MGSENLVAVLLLFGGAVGLMVSVLSGVGTMVREADASPGKRALTHWAPIAVMGVMATLLGRSDIGMGVVFGTSVAALSGVAGCVVMAGTVEAVPPEAGRAWALLPVATILAFMAGFQGNVGVFEAVVLALEGLLVMGVWLGGGSGKRGIGESERGRNGETGKRGQVWVVNDASGVVASDPGAEEGSFDWRLLGQRSLKLAQVVAVILLAAVAAWAATRGAQELGQHDARYSGGAVAAALLSVALAMPMVGTGVPLAAEGRGWVALTTQVGLVYLNLCALLPAVILLPWAARWATTPAGVDATTQSEAVAAVFPRIAWRIDALAAIILSLVFVAAAGGRVKFDRRLAGGLVLGYLVYLLSVLAASMKA